MLKTRHVILLACLLALSVAAGTMSVAAQTVGGSQGSEALISAGEDAMAKGQYAAAAADFGRALRADDLDEARVARTLYQRGVAQERAGKPAQAIADITSALYLQGLANEDRAKAYLSRGRAYEAVGMNDLARSDIARAKSGGVDERQIANSAERPEPSNASGAGPSFETSTAPAGGRNPAPSFETTSQAARAPEPSFETRADAPAAPAPRRRVASADTQTPAAPERKADIPRFRTTIAPSETREEKPAANNPPAGAPAAGWSTAAAEGQVSQGETQEKSGSGVGRFLGNLWTNRTGDEEKKTASAEPTPEPAPAAPQWNQTTSASRAAEPNWNAQVAEPSQTRAPAPPVASAQPAPASAGASGYRIQLAALRTSEEAQAAWERLQSRHRSLLGNRQPNIVQTELGGLGTFYRVQLGPFTDKESSKRLCEEFKAGGLDCFLLAP